MPEVDQNLAVEEFLAGGSDAAWAAIYAAQAVSPLYLDDNTQQFGSDIYERMLKDTEVASAFETFTLAVCADGVRISPAPGGDSKDEADKRNVYAKWVEDAITAGEIDLSDVALELMDAAAYGSRVAEIVLQPGMGDFAGKLIPKSLKVKSAKHMEYVLARDGSLVGIRPTQPIGAEQAQALAESDETKVETWNNVIPRWKFIVHTFRPKENDVLGRSILRPAYTPWFIKTQLLPEFFRFLKLFAGGSVVGKLPKPVDDPAATNPLEQVFDENGQPVISDGKQVFTPKAKKLLEQLIAWKNAYALVVPGGTEIDLMTPDSDGQAFQHAFDYFGRQIHEAILGTSQATKEAQHESRSSKSVGQDVMGLRVANARRKLGNAMKSLSRLLVWVNFGESETAFAPNFSLSKLEQQDRFTAMTAYSDGYAKGFIKLEQLPALYDELGLPPVDIEVLREEVEMNRVQAGELGRLVNP